MNLHARRLKHSLYYIYARKIYMRTHVKITRLWRSGLMCHYIYTTYLCTLRELLQPAGWRLYQITTLKHFSLPSVKGRTIFLPEVLDVFALDLSCYKTSSTFNRYERKHIGTFYGKPELKKIRTIIIYYNESLEKNLSNKSVTIFHVLYSYRLRK